MLHIALHFLVPIAVALVVYRDRWRRAALLMVATMAVDLDHLLAVPVYDPDRCSINFHPLHSTLAIVLYAVMFVAPLVIGRDRKSPGLDPRAWVVHVIGLGLLTHMALDWGDCLRQAAEDGHGIVLEPSFILYRSIEEQKLRPILTDFQWPTIHAHAVYPHTRHLSQRVRAFVDFLAERFAGVPYWDRCLPEDNQTAPAARSIEP